MRDKLKNGNTITTGQKTYIISDFKSSGASSLVYYAYTKIGEENAPYIVKEYYPINLKIGRDPSGRLIWESKYNEKFEKGLHRFKASIEVQIRIRREANTQNQTFCIVDQFEYNNTYYIVMPIQYGLTYDEWKERSLKDKLIACRSIANYVKECHSIGYLCLDLKPENILVLEDYPEYTMYFDFDSLRKKDSAINHGDFSYTEKWAAPEQKTPSEYYKISEATDVFLMGEIIFWSVFKRNSTPDEHYRVSVYDYDNTDYSFLKNKEIRELFTNIFRHTLRASADNRFKDIKQIIILLDKVIDVIKNISQGLKTTEPVSVQCIGRADEVKWLADFFDNEKTGNCCFLIGEDGIGKKTIARKYARDYRENYCQELFIKFKDSLSNTISRAQLTDDFQNHINENKTQLCKRKLKEYWDKFDSDERALIVVEGFNKEKDALENEDAGLLDIIKELPCDIIILSNKPQKISACLRISPLNMSEIKELIGDLNYSYESDQDEFINKLIEKVGYNTFCVKMLTEQLIYKRINPEKLVDELEKIQLSEIPKEELDLFEGHIIELYKIILNYGFSEYQLDLLIKSCFLPNEGVPKDVYDTIVFDDEEDNNEEECIEDDNENEYIDDNDENDDSELPETSELQLFIDTRIVRLDDKNTVCVDPIVSKTVLLCNGFSESKIGKALHAFSNISEQIIFVPISKIGFAIFRRICEEIVSKICEYSLLLECCGNFIVKYVFDYRKIILPSESIKLLQYSISIFDVKNSASIYSRGREMAYLVYYYIVYKQEKRNIIKKIFDNHYNNAKKNKDKVFQLLWKLCRNCVIATDNNGGKQGLFKYVYKAHHSYAFFVRFLRLMKKKVANCIIYADISKDVPGYPFFEDFVDQVVSECLNKRSFLLGVVIWAKKKLDDKILDMSYDNKKEEVNIYNKNSEFGLHYIKAILTNAYSYYHKGLTNLALKELGNLASIIYNENEAFLYTNLLSVYGRMAYELNDYSNSAEVYQILVNSCVANSIPIRKEYLLHLENSYVEINDLVNSKKIHDDLLDLPDGSVIDDNPIWYSGEEYNKALVFIKNKDYESAKECLKEACKKIEALCTLINWPRILVKVCYLTLKFSPWLSNRNYIFLARAYRKYGEVLLILRETKLAKKNLKKAKHLFKLFFGKKYHETKLCNTLLYYMKECEL